MNWDRAGGKAEDTNVDGGKEEVAGRSTGRGGVAAGGLWYIRGETTDHIA